MGSFALAPAMIFGVQPLMDVHGDLDRSYRDRPEFRLGATSRPPLRGFTGFVRSGRFEAPEERSWRSPESELGAPASPTVEVTASLAIDAGLGATRRVISGLGSPHPAYGYPLPQAGEGTNKLTSSPLPGLGRVPSGWRLGVRAL
jgi:hypothetical protein